jgi:hypothetical protein
MSDFCECSVGLASRWLRRKVRNQLRVFMRDVFAPGIIGLLVVCLLRNVAGGATITPSVDAFIRDGLDGTGKNGTPDVVIDSGGGLAVVQIVNVPSFEDRGIIEFPLFAASTPVTSARLVLPIYSANGPFPLVVSTYAYNADGSASLSDFDGGVHIGSFSYTSGTPVILDVTSIVSAFLSAGIPYIGFNFRLPPSSIELNGPFIAFGSLEIGGPARLFINDEDFDGIADRDDQCAGTSPGAPVNATGCSIDQICPCSGPWRNHHEYVACVRNTAADFVRGGFITRSDAREVTRQAQRSDCGR